MIPLGTSFVANMIHTEVVQDHHIPVIGCELSGQVSGYIVVNLCEILSQHSVQPFDNIESTLDNNALKQRSWLCHRHARMSPGRALAMYRRHT